MVSLRVFSRIKQKTENSDVLVYHVLFWVSPRNGTANLQVHKRRLGQKEDNPKIRRHEQIRGWPVGELTGSIGGSVLSAPDRVIEVAIAILIAKSLIGRSGVEPLRAMRWRLENPKSSSAIKRQLDTKKQLFLQEFANVPTHL